MEFPKTLSSRNHWEGEQSSYKDLFHSLHVLYRRCEGLTNACYFHRFAFKLGNVQSVDHRNLSLAVYFFSKHHGKLCFMDIKDKYYLSDVIFLKFKLFCVRICQKVPLFLWILSGKFNDLIDKLVLLFRELFRYSIFRKILAIYRKPIYADTEMKEIFRYKLGIE